MGEEPTCYLSTPQAAALLGLSPRTLESYRVTGGGPPFLTYCNRVHYLRSDLDAWAIEGRRRSTSNDGGAEGGRRRRSPADRAGRAVETRCGRAGPPREAEPAALAPEGAARFGGATEAGSAHLSVAELAALLQVSRRTLDRYRARGEGPASDKVDGRVRYARASVEAWLASGRRAPTSDPGESAGDPDGTGPGAGDDAPEGA